MRQNFPLTPRGIIEHLDLRRPIYRKTAAFGHFGRDDKDFTWEATDKAAALREAAGLQAESREKMRATWQARRLHYRRVGNHESFRKDRGRQICQLRHKFLRMM